MEPNSDAQEFAVLFVDDEGPSCDVLCDALAGRLRVITADSVDKALAVLERQGHDIGVLLTDQRMPGRSGVDLLKLVRERWPSIVRLLTTAYTDYDDAIAAVNRGEILRYIHKPWDIRTLRMELEHAMELFVLRQERERLIEEKLSTRQRLVEAGRARDLLVLCAALGLRDTAAAVGDFLAQTSAGNPSGGPSSLGRHHSMQEEALRSIAIARELRTMLKRATEGDDTPAALAELLTTTVSRSGAKIEGSCALARLPAVHLSRAATACLLELLLEKADDRPVELAATGDASALALTITRPARRNREPAAESAAGARAPEARTLAAFLLTRHLGGTLSFRDDGAAGVFSLSLPLDAKAAMANETSRIERVFASFESNDAW
ncbi:response regulator [Methylogaea oryzae]|uniref:Response regulatory domain-containing protein n=1 Tax=Methylogaea oryzae TaxID=1295382 RepID=A0A8D5AHY6_9GAMM|nr:response regulator [Methylogaea oryzae]BBL70766.1 hypothetical protein MoryE10_13720 [Methylogaea oryzae]